MDKKYYKSKQNNDIWKVYSDRTYSVYSDEFRRWIRQRCDDVHGDGSFLFADWLILSWELKEITEQEAFVEII